MNMKVLNTVLALFVIAICLIWSYFLLFSDFFMTNLSILQRRGFAVFLLLYACYRTYRLYIFLQKNK